MTYESDQTQQQNISVEDVYEGVQEKRELKAKQEYKDRVIKEHERAAQGNRGFSSTAYGRKLIGGSIEKEEQQISRLVLLGNIIRSQAYPKKAPGKIPTWRPILQQMLETIEKAIELRPKNGIKPYATKETKAEEILSLVIITTLVDYAAINSSNGWGSLQEMIERTATRIRQQYLDAYCYTLNPALYTKVEKRWQRAHQTGKNKVANISLGQATLIAADKGIDRKERKSKEAKAIIRKVRQELTRIGEDGEEGRPIQLACKHILDLAILHLDILQKVEPVRLSSQKKDIWRVKPTDALIEEWRDQVLPSLTKARLQRLPLVEAPVPWEYEEDLPGRDNVSGGYHLFNVAAANPLVRQHGGKSKSVPSKSAVELANNLGATGYLLDADQAEAFDWAIEKGYEEELGIPTKPLQTVAELDAEGDVNKKVIEKHGHIFDDRGKPLLKGTPEHDEWKAKRKKAYDEAIEKQAKYLRTVGIRAGLNDLKQQDRLFYSWSFDGRLRIYPQQSASIHPQGSSIERSLLTFEKGERIKEGSAAHDEVLQQIGTSWKGDKCSHAARKAHGIEALKELGSQIDLHDPADISTLYKANADDPWALMQQLRCYENTFNGDGLWNIPAGIDASQSGLQLLSAMCRDEAGMVNTNLILPEGYQSTDGPVDGYQKVADAALKLLKDEKWIEKMGICQASLSNINKMLEEMKTRTLAKRVVLPLPYGSTIDGSRDAVRKCLRDDYGIKAFDEYVDTEEFAWTLAGRWREKHPTAEGRENYFLDLQPTNTIGWMLSERIIRDLTTVLRAAAARVYPAAMSALAWLEKLSSKAMEKQLSSGQRQPFLHWQLHDGSSIWFNRMKKKSRQVPSISCGNIRLSSGDDPLKPNKTKMRQWMAPSVVHAFDGLLLREAFSGWSSDRPLMCVHDQVSCLPSELPGVRERLREAFITICENNSLQSIAEGMNVDMSGVKLITGQADLSKIRDSVFMFH